MQIVNPYLPSWEYVPDGEPHVFNERVYVYGSHDRFNAPIFCLNDYVCWSSPADNLKDWRYEGIIYRKKQDPCNKAGIHLLFAPDIVQGADGRFYLYYAFDFIGLMGVAVCDSPCGQFEFYGHIRHPDGTQWGRKRGDSFPFDPAVLRDDDGRIFLYSGFYNQINPVLTGGVRLKSEGCCVLELEKDMITMKSEKLMIPKKGPEAFKDHEFFEASSIRKYDGRYIFVYSSCHNHELCYAVSDQPDRDFQFKGTLISNGDLYLNGNPDERHAANYIGNNHGGILRLDGTDYIFYHRQTNRHSYSRQACAERLHRDREGNYLQAEMTSCGLNGGPLQTKGTYPAGIACNLWSAKGTGRYDVPFSRLRYAFHPYITQEGRDRDQGEPQYIANMFNGAVAGYKYFLFNGNTALTIQISGRARGRIEISTDRNFRGIAGMMEIDLKGSGRRDYETKLMVEPGIHPVFIRYRGKGRINFYQFTFHE